MSISEIPFVIQQKSGASAGIPDQLILPSFATALADRSRRGIGALGEKTAAHLLEQSGYQVSFCQLKQKRGDLRAVSTATGQIHQVEVKTARRCKDGKWRFTLWLKNKIDHRHADVVMLLAVLESGRVITFVVPVEQLADQHQAVITSHPEKYNGKLARYRQQGVIAL